MSDNSLFISYAHSDMDPTHWLDRLKLYLAPLRRDGLVDVWDDSRIQAGSEWRTEIQDAMERATAAILIVGPAFIASEFISNNELPVLLAAAKSRGTKIYPLVVGYCSYRRSVLGPYQAFNDPDMPLEAISKPEQNKILNDLSLSVDQDLRHSLLSAKDAQDLAKDAVSAMREIRTYLDNTRTAFVAQCRRRDALVKMIKDRLKVEEHLEFEHFFFRYYGELNDEEKFHFEQIRAMTEGSLYEGNKAIVRVIEEHPVVLDEVPALADLRQHLVFWLNKYDKVFSKRAEMCLLYTGVEDGVPFPKTVEHDLNRWLAKHA